MLSLSLSSTSTTSIIATNSNSNNGVDILSVVVFVGSAMSFMVTSRLLRRHNHHHRRHRQHYATQCYESSSSGGTNHDNEKNLSKDDVLGLRQKYVSSNVSVSYSNRGPLMVVKGAGSRLYDESGVSYLDTRNNVAHVGHSNPHIINAVTKQLQMINTNTRYVHPNMSLLAQKLVNLFPPQTLQVVVFVNSGSEANDLALRIARACNPTSKNTIVVDRAYHGHTLAALEISPYKYEHSKEYDGKLVQNPPLSSNTTVNELEQRSSDCDSSTTYSSKTPGRHIYKVPCPDTYRGIHRRKRRGSGNTDDDDAQLNDNSDNEQLQLGVKYAKYVQNACDYYTNHCNESVNAFIIEGGMSVAGVILPPQNYIQLSVKAVRKAGGLYIADEVQTGFGRLGTCMWAFQYNNINDNHCNTDSTDEVVVPDIVTVGKPFGNGMPLGAVIMTREVANKFESMNVEYFNTFGGNPVCAASGLAMLDVLEQQNLQQHALEVGNCLITKFRNLQNRQQQQQQGQDCLPLIGDVRGSGLFVGIELVRDHKTLEPATEETSYLCTTLKEKYNILSSIDGMYDNVLVVKPPLTFTKDDVNYFVECFEKAITIDFQQVGYGNIRNKMSKTPT